MPAYAKDDKVVCFFQSGQKFKTRYATLGFQDAAKLDEGHMWPTGFALKGIKFLDDRIANPSYGVLLLTGLLIVFLAGYSLTTLWIDIALVLFVVLVIIAATQYTPTVRNQIKLAEAGETTSAEFTRLAHRGQLAGQALGVIVLVILGMMVFKPHL
ncbi:MAG: hypothetical protein NVS1B3_05920 [Candidatus Dormibacteraceae bacterium]